MRKISEQMPLQCVRRGVTSQQTNERTNKRTKERTNAAILGASECTVIIMVEASITFFAHCLFRSSSRNDVSSWEMWRNNVLFGWVTLILDFCSSATTTTTTTTTKSHDALLCKRWHWSRVSFSNSTHCIDTAPQRKCCCGSPVCSKKKKAAMGFSFPGSTTVDFMDFMDFMAAKTQVSPSKTRRPLALTRGTASNSNNTKQIFLILYCDFMMT